MREFYPLKYKIKLIGPKSQTEIEAQADTCKQFSMIGSELLMSLGYKQNKLQIFGLFRDKTPVYSAKVKILVENQKFHLRMVEIKEGLDPMGVVLGADFFKKINILRYYINGFSHLYKLIKQSKRKCVLILGSYAKERVNILYAIKDCLKKLGYEGILLKDYPDIEEQSNEEKMNLFGNIARFMICENTSPSGHINELNICSRNTLVTIMIQEQGCKSGATGMQSSYPIDFNFVRKVFYNPENLDSAVRKAVKLGEELVVRRKRKLNKEYAYRKKGLI